ncbi:MAG TPA: arsenate reductase (glutaredoxin) [Dongiaceae bacterium]
MSVTIFHNPNCGTSRGMLQALKDAGHAPQVVEYLKAGWNEAQLADLFDQMGVKPRDMLRVRGTPAEELGLTKPDVGDAQILRAMTLHPILVERPIVITPKGVFLCRPADRLAAAL